ncbi:VOC family protein [Actinokineospora globicatena]|uniref:Glyoxalase n=1 Tax=Actinokineospora globicatena TaxID=103729 RepID=A0A9W6QK76_9PSEU|nr:VOC family protein [Actinokineospora globicatena]GLW90097.1 glyoxalase [Actinokineospora globicatena]
MRSIVFDTREPQRLAAFYAGLLGGKITTEEHDWYVVTDPDGRRIACQLSAEHEAPRFPDPAASQQVHLDVLVDDIDDAERQVLALGAVRVTTPHPEGGFRVFLDPAGHPFCLIPSDAIPS